MKKIFVVVFYFVSCTAASALTDSVTGFGNFMFGKKIDDFDSISFDHKSDGGLIVYRANDLVEIMSNTFQPFLLFDQTGLVAVDLSITKRNDSMSEANRTCEQLFGTAFGAIKAKYGNSDTGVKTKSGEYSQVNEVSFTAVDASGIHLTSIHLMYGCSLYVRYEKGSATTF